MHLYIHIPFCENKCHYCSFTSLKKKDYELPYLNALIQDLHHQFEVFKCKKKSIKTLFIGGGTPSIMGVGFYEKIFYLLDDYLLKNSEKTIEANPNSTNICWLKEIKHLGLNRISFGAQSFHEKKLNFLGRIHNQKSIYTSIENAKKAGFSNINLDLIYDTKLDTKKMLDYELNHISNLKNNLTHISAYNLSIEPYTMFAKKEHYKKNAPLLMKYFINKLIDLGFPQYEISNFGKICKHNLAYWQGKDYIGCGLSAVGFLKNKRFYTKKNLKDYINNPTFRSIEKLQPEELSFEHLFLGLRSLVGIQKNKLDPMQLKNAYLLKQEKKLTFKNGKFYNKNFLLSDEIALYINSKL